MELERDWTYADADDAHILLNAIDEARARAEDKARRDAQRGGR